MGVVSSVVAGKGARGFSDGLGTLASFNLPFGVVSVRDILYITDTYNNVIRSIK